MQKDFTLSIGNIIWIIGIIFTMGTAYSQIAQLEEDIEVLERRLEKKIKLVNECEDRIVELEKDLATFKNCKNHK
jgi:energy-converting hydrogenase Eha subunit H